MRVKLVKLCVRSMVIIYTHMKTFSHMTLFRIKEILLLLRVILALVKLGRIVLLLSINPNKSATASSKETQFSQEQRDNHIKTLISLAPKVTAIPSRNQL